MTTAEADQGVGAAIGEHVYPVMDAMDQQGKWMPCGGAFLSDATCAMARIEASVSDGLWHMTQYSMLFRNDPWTERFTWH